MFQCQSDYFQYLGIWATYLEGKIDILLQCHRIVNKTSIQWTTGSQIYLSNKEIFVVKNDF